MRDDRLRSDPVRANRQADPADVDHIGKIADIQFDGAEATRRRPCLLDALDDLVEAGLRRCGVDAGRFIELLPGVHDGPPLAVRLCAIRRAPSARVNSAAECRWRIPRDQRTAITPA